MGHKEVPCVVIQAGEERCAVLALTENLQRRPLHYLEEAERLDALLKIGALIYGEVHVNAEEDDMSDIMQGDYSFTFRVTTQACSPEESRDGRR